MRVGPASVTVLVASLFGRHHRRRAGVSIRCINSLLGGPHDSNRPTQCLRRARTRATIYNLEIPPDSLDWCVGVETPEDSSERWIR